MMLPPMLFPLPTTPGTPILLGPNGQPLAPPFQHVPVAPKQVFAEDTGPPNTTNECVYFQIEGDTTAEETAAAAALM